MDVLCIVRRILNNICSFLRWCSSFHLGYFSILLLFVQFSPGVRAVFYWCLDSFLHAHTHNKHTRARKQMHTRVIHTHSLTHAVSQTQTITYTEKDTNAQSHTHTLSHTDTLTDTHTYTQAYRRSRTTPTHMQTHGHTHTESQTLIHINTDFHT